MLLSFRFWFFKGVAGHFPRNVLKQLQQLMGIDTTVAVGKLWVCINGQYMFLPVYVVQEEKWNRSRGKTSPVKFLYRDYKKSELLYLKDFTRATVCGLGAYYEIANSDILGYFRDRNPYIVKVSDIENYKKEKFTKKV